jgi:hypothetical protein
MLHLIREHVIFRLHETSSRQRICAYHFALLALRHLPQIFDNQDHAKLINSLKRHLEQFPFFLLPEEGQEHLACQLAFWLSKPICLVEMIETSHSTTVIANAMYGLLTMGRHEWVDENLHYLEDEKERGLLCHALLYFRKGPSLALEALCRQLSSSVTNKEMRCAYFLFERSLLEEKSAELLPYFQAFPSTPFMDSMKITASLLQNDLRKAQELLDAYTPEILSNEYSPLFVPTGCYLLQTEGEEIALSHFSGSIDLPHPPTTMLLSYFLRGKIEEKKGWITQALQWEKVALFRQISLYFHCAKNPEKEMMFSKRLKSELKKLATL